ncbi:MAG: hypothetical protein CSB44_09220 [Gammaproteobacteria bacterium]|nr:MAG: hypothetical protein CSB44_09220 [Gammaproteobacteria bacterium]
MKASRPPVLYRLLLRALSPLLFVQLVRHALGDGGWRYFRERLGMATADMSTTKTPVDIHTHRDPAGKATETLWIHAASVGEVITAAPLVEALMDRLPDWRVLISTNTPTGAATVAGRFDGRVEHAYLPIDFPGACRRFLKRVSPTRALVVETEIWPWLYALAHERGIPISIINARLSPKTRPRAGSWIARGYQRALAGVGILARSDADAERFRHLGAEPERVTVVGNLKFAGMPIAFATNNAPSPVPRPYVLAASTHKGEELAITRAWLTQLDEKTSGTNGDASITASNPLLVFVPRYPERGSEIQHALATLGVKAGRRSLDPGIQSDERVHIADTLGELPLWYRHAAASFVGGSLMKRGGQNMIEPLVAGSPTVVGPITYNFDDIMALLEAENAITVAADATAVAGFLAAGRGQREAHPAHASQQAGFARVRRHIGEVLPRYLEILLTDD